MNYSSQLIVAAVLFLGTLPSCRKIVGAQPGLRAVVLFGAVGLLIGTPAAAQTLSRSRPARFEVAATMSGAQPSVTVVSCCELRTPERYLTTDRTFTTVAAGATIRLLWGSKASTHLDIEWSPAKRRGVETSSPSSIPAPIAPGFLSTAVVGRETERSAWTLTAGQGIDLIRRDRWRASVSAGIVIDRVQERYEQTSLVYGAPPAVTRYHSVRRETSAAGAGTVAVTVYVVPRAFITAETSVRRYFTHTSLERAGFQLKVGFGVGFGED